jgi:DNA-binding FadR family transcriptional regulator
MTDKEIGNLYDVIRNRHKMKQERNGPTMFLDRNDLDFHHAIVLGSKNKRLGQFLSGDLYYLLKVYRFRSGSQADRAQDVLQEHMAIADAVAARDAVLAETLMRRHIRIARDSMVRQFARTFAESAAPNAESWEKSPRRRGRKKEGKPAVSAAEG